MSDVIKKAVIQIALETSSKISKSDIDTIASSATDASKKIQLLQKEIESLKKTLSSGDDVDFQVGKLGTDIHHAQSTAAGGHGSVNTNPLMRGIHHGLVTGSPEAGAHKALQRGINDVVEGLSTFTSRIGIAAATVNILAGAAGIAAIAFRSLNQWAVEDSKHEREVAARYSGIHDRYASQAVMRHAEGAIRISESVADIHGLRQTGINQRNRSQTEAEIVAAQGASGRDFAHVQEIRARMERANELREKQQEAQNALVHVNSQQNALGGAKTQYESDVRNAEQAHASHMRNIKNKRRGPTGISWGWGLLTGQESDFDVNVSNTNLKEEQAKAEAQYAENLNHQKEAGIKLDQQQLALGQKRVEAASNLLNSLRDQASAARQNYENDKQEVAAGHQNIGAMSLGDQAIIKQIEEKRKRGEKLEKWERDKARGLRGTKLADEVRRDDEAEGAALGIEMAPNVQESKGKWEQAQANLSGKEPELVKLINEQSKKNEALAAQIAEAVRKAFDLTELVATLNKILEDQRQLTQEQIMKLKRFLG